VVSVDVEGMTTVDCETGEPSINFWKLLLATTSPGLSPDVMTVLPESEIPDFTVVMTALPTG
jgi:hypothetical protein